MARRPRGVRLREVIPTEEAIKRALAPLATQGRSLGVELLCEVTSGVGGLVLGNERQLVDTLVRAVGRAMATEESGEIRVRIARQFAGFAPSDCVIVTVTTGAATSEVTQLELVLPTSAHETVRLDAAPGARVLVVTPSSEGARIIVGGVRAAGALATSVLDVSSAHDRLRAACRAGARFDLVYVDDALVEMTIPFLQSLRDDPTFGRAPALVATALPRGSREHFSREGAFAVLVKPVLPRELGSTMARVLLVGGRARSSRPPTSAERLRVLLADEDPVSALFARRALEQLGHDVVELARGASVMDALAREPFDAVLLDLVQPTFDALGVARAVRAGREDRWPATMVIALAADEMDDAACESAGIHAVLEKPVNREQLASALTRRVEVDRPSHERLICAEPVGQAPQQVLDLADLRARTANDESLIAELFEDFLRHGGRWSDTLHEAAEARAFGDLSPLAHRLRGALTALGAKCAGKAAADIETHSFAMAAGTDTADTRALLARALTDLTEGLEKVRAAMREYLVGAPSAAAVSTSSP